MFQDGLLCCPRFDSPKYRHRVSRQDALVVGIKIQVRENEPIRFALQRLGKKTRHRSKGSFRWMREASLAKAGKIYYLKPSFLNRMKKVRRKFWAQKWSYCFEGGRPPE